MFSVDFLFWLDYNTSVETFCERFEGLLPRRIFFENSHALLKFCVKMLANASRLRIFT